MSDQNELDLSGASDPTPAPPVLSQEDTSTPPPAPGASDAPAAAPPATPDGSTPPPAPPADPAAAQNQSPVQEPVHTTDAPADAPVGDGPPDLPPMPDTPPPSDGGPDLQDGPTDLPPMPDSLPPSDGGPSLEDTPAPDVLTPEDYGGGAPPTESTPWDGPPPEPPTLDSGHGDLNDIVGFDPSTGQDTPAPDVLTPEDFGGGAPPTESTPWDGPPPEPPAFDAGHGDLNDVIGFDPSGQAPSYDATTGDVTDAPPEFDPSQPAPELGDAPPADGSGDLSDVIGFDPSGTQDPSGLDPSGTQDPSGLDMPPADGSGDLSDVIGFDPSGTQDPSGLDMPPADDSSGDVSDVIGFDPSSTDTGDTTDVFDDSQSWEQDDSSYDDGTDWETTDWSSDDSSWDDQSGSYVELDPADMCSCAHDMRNGSRELEEVSTQLSTPTDDLPASLRTDVSQVLSQIRQLIDQLAYELGVDASGLDVRASTSDQTPPSSTPLSSIGSTAFGPGTFDTGLDQSPFPSEHETQMELDPNSSGPETTTTEAPPGNATLDIQPDLTTSTIGGDGLFGSDVQIVIPDGATNDNPGWATIGGDSPFGDFQIVTPDGTPADTSAWTTAVIGGEPFSLDTSMFNDPYPDLTNLVNHLGDHPVSNTGFQLPIGGPTLAQIFNTPSLVDTILAPEGSHFEQTNTYNNSWDLVLSDGSRSSWS